MLFQGTYDAVALAGTAKRSGAVPDDALLALPTRELKTVHIMLMIGSPGTGKTMLAKRLPTILPPLTPDESLGTTRISSALGRLDSGQPLLATRSFRAPHYTISDAGWWWAHGARVGQRRGDVIVWEDGTAEAIRPFARRYRRDDGSPDYGD